MNLVVVAGSPDLADRYLPVADEVAKSALARAIVVALAPDDPRSELHGEATAICGVDEGPDTCIERVRIFASGNMCSRVASTVEALLVPEIPTTIVWLGKVYVDDPVFESLAKVAQQIITDSEYTSVTNLMHLTRWSRESHDRPKIADLAWTRLAGWQDLVARFFDDPKLQPFAQAVTKLTLRQASDKGARLGSEGSLLLGWLGTRLGWKASRLGGALRFRRPDGGNITVEFGVTPRPEGVAPFALSALTLVAEVDGQKLVGTLERDLGSGLEDATKDADVVLWKLTVGDGPEVMQRVRFGANKGAKWLERTLRRPPGDPALMESAQFAEDAVEDGILCNG
jgi:glucose-6-phosphate dehydrogenase assembly protein OpcA